MLYNHHILIITLLGLTGSRRVENTPGSAFFSKPNSKINIDTFTPIFYHVENTRKCGDNLETFNVDLKPVWYHKFHSQIEKTFLLANSLNHLLNTNESIGNDIRIIESNLLPALSYFIFIKPNPAVFDSKIDPNLVNELRKQNLKKFYDPYLIGFGVLLFYDKPVMKNPMKCFYLYTKSNSTEEIDANNLVKNKACLPLSDKEQTEGGPQKENENPNFSFHSMDSMSKNNNLNSFYKNCNNWYENMANSYKKSKIREDYDSENPTSFSYKKYLRNILEDEELASSLWCGPYFECNNPGKKNSNDWILIYSLPLFDMNKKLKGAVSIKLKITNMNINQCDSGDSIFAGTHKCKKNSDCVYTPKNKFTLGSYTCKCQGGFINSNGNISSYDGSILENQYWLMKSVQNRSYIENFNCQPCDGPECCAIDSNLIDNNLYTRITDQEMVKEYQNQLNIFWHCRKYNFTMRFTILIVQITFMMIVLILSVIVFYFRQNKIIKHSMWILLELMLFGAFLLYFTLIIQYFEPTANNCIAIPWFRELGFTIVYGILNLRLYKILIEFQSRKAHCVQLKDKDILRILFVIIICVLGYLVAWTLGDLGYASEGFSLVTNTSLKGYIQYPICKTKWWDYFIEIGEFAFICVGFYLLYCTRTAPSEFNERKFISLVIYFEGFVSTFLHIIKHSINNSIHPDTILLLYFIRCHTTVTMMLLFIFATKLCILFRTSSDDNGRSTRLHIEANVANQDFMKQIGQGEFNVEDLNLIDMEPEEIRSELKRLYTQIHVYRMKSIKVNNPHIQKKKKDMKKVRRLSNAFQKSSANVTETQVKTPEESICSNDMTTTHGNNIEEKISNLGSYLFQNVVSTSNPASHFTEDNKSIQSRLNETSESKQMNLTSSNDTTTQPMTPKVQFKKS